MVVRSRFILLTAMTFFFAFSPALTAVSATNPAGTASPAANSGSSSAAQGAALPDYTQMAAEWEKEGAAAVRDSGITVSASKLADRSDGSAVTVGPLDGQNNVLIWQPKGVEWIEYEVDVPKGGLYGITMSYHPFVDPKYQKPISFKLTVDGSPQFQESQSIQLYRQWQDQFPIQTDDNGDQIRPLAHDQSGWMTWQLRDMSGSYADPLLWRLTPGKHRIRLSGSDPVALASLVFKAPAVTGNYKEILHNEPQHVSSVKADPIVLEAEQESWKSDSSISLGYDNDIGNHPYVEGKIAYNTIGGSTWSSGNQEINWRFTAPADGYYKIAMRAQQSFIPNHSSFRTILINGEVPFSELKAYRFVYNYGWQGEVLADEQGTPYKFYLHKGQNSISMRVTEAPYKPIADDLRAENGRLKQLYDQLITLTGGVADSNRTWDIEKEIPGFMEDFRGVYARLEEIRQRLIAVNGRQDAISQVLTTIRQDMENLLQNENEIPYNASRLTQLQGQLADQINQVSSQPLQLDRIYITPYEKAFPAMLPTFWQKLVGGFENFIYSFKAQHVAASKDDQVLNVWVLRGRDYVNLLQQLTDATFTPKTGIKVKVNLLKDEKVLMLMNAAGKAPDVVLGLPTELQFNYAIRNAVYNLKNFPDFNTMYQRFAPGMWVPFYYEDGYYGVPETTTMEMMYYRADIFQRLGIKVPNTWDELYKILPILQQNGMNFPPVGDGIFLQMHGAKYYTQDGTKAGFGTPAGYDAFKQWTDLQNKYGLDQNSASFYQHFRDGSYPIGIADLNTYIQLKVAAPELNGLWGMAPIPGVEQNGQVVRWTSGSLQSSMIFKQTKMPQQSWEYLKWWTSEAAQEEYGAELETLNGITFRWNTANIAAFVKLPWTHDDLQAILEQWRWFRAIPNVPGNYYLQRNLVNAWTRTVVDGQSYRTSLDTLIQNMNGEIGRKEQEFNIVDKSGNLIRSLNLPVITKPWDGVDQYVTK